MFTPVGQTKAFLDIAQQIKRNIEEGNLEIGSRLPSERKFAEYFQTSRATVREALRALEIIGVIESKVGQGTFVASNFVNTNELFVEIEKQTSPSEVFEARFAIEPYLAKLAAIRATEQELNEMEEILKKSEKSVNEFDIPTFEALDGEFHYLIASMAKNSFLLKMTNIINGVRIEKLWGTMKKRSLNEERMINYQEQHIALYEAIKERDSLKAKEMLLIHLKQVQSNMLGI